MGATGGVVGRGRGLHHNEDTHAIRYRPPWGSPQEDQLVGRLRDRPGGHDPGHRRRPVRRAECWRGLHPTLLLRHGRGRHPLLLPGRAGSRDARPDRRHALLRLRDLQGPRAGRRPAHRRHLRLGLRPRLVPCGAHQHDPRRPLHRHPLGHPAGAGVHPHQRADQRDGHLDLRRRTAPPVHPLLPGHPARSGVCDPVRRRLDGPPDPPRLPPLLQAGDAPLEQRLRVPPRRPDRSGRRSRSTSSRTWATCSASPWP